MEKIFIDFRKNGFLKRRIHLFDKITYVLLDELPKKTDYNNFDLKFELGETLIIEAKVGFFDYDALKLKTLNVDKNIFVNYSDYTLHIMVNRNFDVFSLNSLIYNSSAMSLCVEELKKVARTSENVVVYGDTGTGKEFLSKLIHFNSVQRSCAYHVFNPALYENEKDLLGSEKGAFTSCLENTKGLFSLLNKGTMVIDGLENMSLKSQSIFLRTLEDKMYKKLGSDSYNKSNFRVISIFNINPMRLIEDGILREDLYYRLSAHTIEVPGLSSRTDDLEPLINLFSRGYKLSYRALELLKEHKYFGNVRELINVLNRAKILSSRGCIDVSNIYFNNIPNIETSFNSCGEGLLKQSERTIITRVLRFTSSNLFKASRMLGVTRVTLRKKIKELN